MGSRNWSSQGQ